MTALAPTRRASTFQEWLDNAKPRDHFIYHKGHLAVDRGPEERRVPEVDALARAVWAAYEAGQITLTQRRTGSHNWNYLATRTQRS